MTNTNLPNKITSLTEFENKAIQQFNNVLNFLKNHPTFSITLVYLMLSCIGLVHLVLLSNYFNIDILPHLEISDVILAPVRYPLIVIFFLLISAGGWLGQKLELRLRKKKRYEMVYNKMNKPFYRFNPLITYSIVGLVVVFVSLDMTSDLTHNNIIKEKTQHYDVSFSNQVLIKNNQVEHLTKAQVIADTVKYLWIYVKEDEQIHAIPQKNIVSLVPVLNENENNQKKEAPL